MLDDEIAKGSTVIELVRLLRENKAASVRVACTHGLFADGALERIGAMDDVLEIVCTNTVPIPHQSDKLTVLSIAPALAEAMRRIHDGESVSVLFEAPIRSSVRACSSASDPAKLVRSTSSRSTSPRSTSPWFGVSRRVRTRGSGSPRSTANPVSTWPATRTDS